MRVIAGELGGRRLHAPHGDRTRPTSDRVREALFMALGSLEGARVVDLFSGSGALAIEALSRGAVWADLVDSDRRARDTIVRNLTELALTERARLWPLRLPAGLARLGEALASAIAIAAPSPLSPPVTSATLPSIRNVSITMARVVSRRIGTACASRAPTTLESLQGFALHSPA